MDELMIRPLEIAYAIEPAKKNEVREARGLVEQLAERLAHENGDLWLRDFARSRDSFLFRSATSFLIRAIKENQAGEPDYALSSAQKAARLFQAHRNITGILRAKFEEVYAFHRMSHGTDCLKAAKTLQRSLIRTQYPWLRAQVGFEVAVCKGLTGDIGGSFSEAENAIVLARDARLQTLVLRGLGLLAELKATNGSDDEAWIITRRGVRMLWSGDFPPMRGYQLYAGIAFAVENRKEWHLAVALNREANWYVAEAGNLSIKAMASYRLAGDALMAGDNHLAADQLSKANLLFAALPQTQAWKAYRAYGELVLAGLNAQKNQLSRSRELLDESEHSLSNLPDYVLELSYLQIEGDLDLRSNRPADAEKAYRSALKIGKIWLNLLRSDNDRLSWNAQMANIYRALVRLYALHQNDPARALAAWEEYHSIAADVTDSDDPSRRSADDWLKNAAESLTDKTLITFVQFEDGLGIWLVDNRGLHFYWQAVTASDMEKRTSRFHLLCSNPISDTHELAHLAQDLYSFLIAPFETQLDPRRSLLLETDTSLAAVPFGALRDRAGHYLAEGFTSVSSPGLVFEKATEHQTGLRFLHLHALVMAPSAPADSSPDLLPLKDAILEAQDVARHFESRTLLSGSEATLDRFGQEIAQSGVFHFAGHAVLRGDAIGLVFFRAQNASADTGSGLFSAETVAKGNLRRLRLIVLAACATAGGSEPDTLARHNLVGDFLREGVPHVVATGWDVDSATTRILMEQFYSDLENDMAVPAAIRSAQLSILRRAQTAHPYYWAAVSAFGGS